MTDVIVTGLPRSGVTLASALIDGLDNAVCLNAPGWQVQQSRKTTDAAFFCKWLIGDYAHQRTRLLKGEPVEDVRAADGRPLTDGIRDPNQPATNDGVLMIKKPGLKPGFILGMKHHALYSSVLPELSYYEHFKIIAIIRNPVDVILSWMSLKDHPLSEGKMPVAARFWPGVADITTSTATPLERMVQLYDAFCKRYYELGHRITVIKYEDLVADPQLIASPVGRDESISTASLVEDRPRLRAVEDAERITAQLRQKSVYAKQYYMFG